MKEPLLLLPGMMCDARLFQAQIAAFSSERPVMVMPMTGHDTIEGLAQDVLDHSPPRFALAGLSMGGILAMEIIRRAPERVTRLALLDTNPKAELPEVQARRQPQIARAKQGRLRDVMVEEMKPNYLVDGPHRAAILDLCLQMAQDLGPDVFISQSKALASRPDQQDALRSVDVPTLVLCGRADTLCPIGRHELMRDLIPDASLVIIENAGHLPVLEQPEKTNEALKAWLT